MSLVAVPLIKNNELAIDLFRLRAWHDVADLVVGIAGVENPDFIDDHALLHFAIGTLDKAVLVDPRKARERRNQTDVRPFRRLDRTDAAVMRGMDVAHLESGA